MSLIDQLSGIQLAVICPCCHGTGDERGYFICSACAGAGFMRQGKYNGRLVAVSEKGEPYMYVGNKDLAI